MRNGSLNDVNDPIGVDILPTFMNSIGHTNVASTAPAMQPLAMAVTGFVDVLAMLTLWAACWCTTSNVDLGFMP
jgi:hypothetical protein